MRSGCAHRTTSAHGWGASLRRAAAAALLAGLASSAQAEPWPYESKKTGVGERVQPSAAFDPALRAALEDRQRALAADLGTLLGADLRPTLALRPCSRYAEFIDLAQSLRRLACLHRRSVVVYTGIFPERATADAVHEMVRAFVADAAGMSVPASRWYLLGLAAWHRETEMARAVYRREANPACFWRVRKARREGTLPALSALIALNTAGDDAGGDAAVREACLYTLCDALLARPDWRGVFARAVAEERAGRAPLAVFEAWCARAGTSPEAVEEDWLKRVDARWADFLAGLGAAHGAPADPPALRARIRDLGAADLAVRDRAQEALVAAGVTVLPALAEAADADEDPEVRTRCDDVVGAMVDASAGGPLAFVREWQVVGPFDNRDDAEWDRMEIPVDRVDLQAEFRVADGVPARWALAVADPAGFVDLVRHVSRQENVSAFASAWIEAREDLDVPFFLGSDDGVKFWLNGTPVASDHAHRAAYPGQDQGVMRLRKGANLLVLKIEQSRLSWGFYFQIPARVAGVSVRSRP